MAAAGDDTEERIPLSVQLADVPAHEQLQSPLFNVLFPELRNIIFLHVLTEYDDKSRPYSKHSWCYRPDFKYAGVISPQLLLTCRRVYLETHLAPIALNEHVFWQHRHPHHGKFSRNYVSYFAQMTPEQRGAVKRVRFFAQMCWLEGQTQPFERIRWSGEERQTPAQRKLARQRAHLALYNAIPAAMPGRPVLNPAPAVPFRGTPASEQQWLEFTGEGWVLVTPGVPDMFLPELLGQPQQSPTTAAAIRSQPHLRALHAAYEELREAPSPQRRWTDGLVLPHAIITIRHSDWWFWEWRQPLRIHDPAQSWGRWIGSFPGIRVLEIELESIDAKKAELDEIVKRALKWKIPLKDGGQLVHDGMPPVQSMWLGTSMMEPPGLGQVLNRGTIQKSPEDEEQLDKKHLVDLKLHVRKITFVKRV
ncbi:hypothetical protein HMN09_00330900 [Mycena chlorophos]|uniref:Uncharacterized protein n=1 Tax=Mycena chlorophos TaxID=658473 RepID=A0A8H6WGW4_MYCCL|nr:hypothetical protein HMN09_00330900 [Mycena chlorophos]